MRVRSGKKQAIAAPTSSPSKTLPQTTIANGRGHYPIEGMGVELGIWQGRYQNLELPWLCWWDNQGNLLQTGWERSQRKTAKLKKLGVNPDDVV